MCGFFVWKLNGQQTACPGGYMTMCLAALTLHVAPGEYRPRHIVNRFLSVVMYGTFPMWVTSLSCRFPIVSDTWLALIMSQLAGNFWSHSAVRRGADISVNSVFGSTWFYYKRKLCSLGNAPTSHGERRPRATKSAKTTSLPSVSRRKLGASRLWRAGCFC